MASTNTDLTLALLHYNWLSEANTTGKIGRTPEAWDACAAWLTSAAESTGVTGEQIESVMARVRDAQGNASMLRARAVRA